MGVGGKYGIFDGCKVGVLQLWTYHSFHILYGFGHGGVAFEIAVQLVAELGGGELGVGGRTKSARIGLFVKLNLAPAHELRPPLAAKAVVFVHCGEQFLSCFVAKQAAKPVLVVSVEGGCTHTVDVPSHVEEQFEVVAGHLGVVDVHYPELAHVVVVGSTHLVVHQARLCGC